MRKHSKLSPVMIAIFILLLMGTVFMVSKFNNGKLLKGQIDKNTTIKNVSTQPPDLKSELEIILPEEKDGNIKVKVVIRNIGKGELTGDIPFKYGIYLKSPKAADYINIFSNTDSYSVLAPNESFSFIYPISRSIYQYGDEGMIKFEVDIDNSIKESNEKNNRIELEYKIEE